MPSFHNSQSRPPQRPAAFRYQERSVDSLKARAERTGSRYDSIYKGGFDSWKPKQGDNLIRFCPPTWDNADHYGYTMWTHSFVGPEQGSYLCLFKMRGKPCPICEAAAAARKAGDEAETRQLTSTERILTWILNRDGDEPHKPLLFQMSMTQDRDIAALCHNRRTHAVLWIDNPDVGYDLSFQRTGTALNTRYFGYQIARDPSPLNEDPRVQNDILQRISDNPLPTVLQFYPYDYISKALLGTGASAAVDDGTGRELLAKSKPASYEDDVTEEEAPLADEEEDDTGGPPWDTEEDEEEVVQPRPSSLRRATLRTR